MSNPTIQPRFHHGIAVHHHVGALHLSVDLNLTAPWTVLFGPSGSGKSSILRAACGLLSKRDISFTRTDLRLGSIEPLQNATLYTPPHRRGIRLAPQNPSLFPHLTVRQNIAFAHKAQPGPGSPGEQDHREELIANAITLFRLTPLLDRRPADLSGGERQRVSMARAFAAPHCRLMLLDEPFTGIDRTLRDELLPNLRHGLLARGIPAISVTHSVEEAFQLQAEVVLIRDGKVEDQGDVSQVLARERERLLENVNSLR